MRRALILATIALSATACSDEKVASKDNFKKVIDAYIGDHPPCIAIPTSPDHPEGAPPAAFPRYVSAASTTSVFQQQARERERAPFDALVDAGLFSVTDTSIKVRNSLFGNGTVDMPVRAYELTPEGKKAVSEVGARAAISAGQQQFCYGKPTVDEVTMFTEPGDVMGVTVSRVDYRYHLADLPAWTTHASMLDAFPQLRRDTASSIDAHAEVIKTGDGWVHERAFKR